MREEASAQSCNMKLIFFFYLYTVIYLEMIENKEEEKKDTVKPIILATTVISEQIDKYFVHEEVVLCRSMVANPDLKQF